MSWNRLVYKCCCILLIVLFCNCIVLQSKFFATNPLGSTTTCCYNQDVVVTSIFCTETNETVPNMCAAAERSNDDVVTSDFVNRLTLFNF